MMITSSSLRNSLIVLVIIAAVTSPSGAQKPRAPQPTQQQIDSLQRRLRERVISRRGADSVLEDKLREALSVNSVGFGRGKTTVFLMLENWKGDLSTAALAPVARKGLRVLLTDTIFHNADTLSVRFSDYTPHVVTLSWTASDFRNHPERFRVERQD